MIPFDADGYLRLFASYNSAFLPIHVAAVLLGAAVVASAFKPWPGAGRLAAGALAVFWLWTGAVFHASEFAVLNWAAPGFGVLFGVQALLLLWVGVARGGLPLAVHRDPRTAVGLGLVLLSALGLAVADQFAGPGWPAIRLFPASPGPLAMATIGLLLLARPRPPWGLLIIPVLWCAMHGLAARELGMTADMIVSAIAVAAPAVLFGSSDRRAEGR